MFDSETTEASETGRRSTISTANAQLDQVTQLAIARRLAVPSGSTYARGDITNALLSYLAGVLNGFPADAWAAAVAYVEAETERVLDLEMVAAVQSEVCS